MNIFLGQSINNVNNGVMQQKVVNNQAFKVVKGKRFTYYIKTDENGIVKEVVARSSRELAPADYFIQNVNTCTKKLVMRVPLRMAIWQYNCPNTKIEYKTFGLPGFLNTEAKLIK
ncbi:MAG: hypothetical protein RXN95_01700 [Hydrogenobaculum sp.]|jgi:hypothetical protein